MLLFTVLWQILQLPIASTDIGLFQQLSLWKLIFNEIDIDSNDLIHSTECTKIVISQIKDSDDWTTEYQNDIFLQTLNKWLINSAEMTSSKMSPFDEYQNMNLSSFIHYFFNNQLPIQYTIQQIDNLLTNELPNKNLQDEIFSSIPEQIHLSLGKNITNSMMVMWITNAETINSVVYYSDNINQIMNDQMRIGNSTTYNTEDSIFTSWKGRIHYCLMDNLSPNTKYYYIVGDGNSSNSEIQTFTSYNPHPDNGYNFAIFGDMGSIQFMGWTVNEQLIEDEFIYNVNTSNSNYGPYDLILHVGDISYAGTGSTREYEYFWDLWMRMTQPISAHVPWMVWHCNRSIAFLRTFEDL